MDLGCEAPDVLRVERVPAGNALLVAICDECLEVTGVGRLRVRRQPPFVAQALQESGHPVRERLAHAPRAVIASVTMSPMRTR